MSGEITPNPIQPKLNLEPEFSPIYLKLLEKHPRSKQICICGHSVNSHRILDDGRIYCTPGNIICRCKQVDVYLSASDARYFKRSTHGWGPKHALGMGLAALQKNGGEARWFRKIECHVPNCPEIDLTVACFSETGLVLPRTSEWSKFVCKTHVYQLGGQSLSLF